MKYSPPFPNGQMSSLLNKKHGFTEADILEIRRKISQEIKRQIEKDDYEKDDGDENKNM